MTKEIGRGKRAITASAPVWDKRSFVARPLGSILPAITDPAFRKQNAVAVRLLLDWPEIVGPALAALTAPRRLSAGTLTVACAGPVAMEIQHLAPQLIERINIHCGPGRTLGQGGSGPLFGAGPQLVTRLKITQDVSVATPASPDRRVAAEPIFPPDMEDGPLRDVLGRLGGYVSARRHGNSEK